MADDRAVEEKEEEEEDDGIDWEYLSSKTEGCQARDLAKLVKRWVAVGVRELCVKKIPINSPRKIRETL